MKKILLSMAAVSALAIGAPVAAQYQNQGYGNGNYQTNVNGNVAARIGQLQARIQAGVQSGAISRQEAQPLRQQLRQLMQLERQYSVNGLSGQERSDLQQRIRTLRQQIQFAEGGQGRFGNQRYGDDDRRYGNDDRRYGAGNWIDRNRDGYDDRDHNRDGISNDDRYGRSDRDGYDDRASDRDGRWNDDRYGRSDRVDRNRDGYDDRDYDRNGRWDDDVNDGRYEQPAQRGGIGGIIGNIFGGGGLRVGQRVSGNLGGVPYEYRDQFRDGNGVYYRSDGRQIYQIDARSQTVVRVFPMNR
jgi:hypothetical protein